MGLRQIAEKGGTQKNNDTNDLIIDLGPKFLKPKMCVSW